MPLPEQTPPGWGADEITKFIDTTRGNAYASFANLKEEYSRLSEIDGALRKLGENLNHTKEWFAAFFVLRAHSSWLAAVNVALSAQIPETYVILRSSLETALYGLRIAKNPSLRETWLRRHDSPKHKAQVLEEFKFRNLIDTLAVENIKEAQVAETLYNQCIDSGAHPNERALMGNLRMDKTTEEIKLKVMYLNPDPLALRLAMKSTARVGVCILGIFYQLYKERFDLLGLTAQLPTLRRGL